MKGDRGILRAVPCLASLTVMVFSLSDSSHSRSRTENVLGPVVENLDIYVTHLRGPLVALDKHFCLWQVYKSPEQEGKMGNFQGPIGMTPHPQGSVCFFISCWVKVSSFLHST